MQKPKDLRLYADRIFSSLGAVGYTFHFLGLNSHSAFSFEFANKLMNNDLNHYLMNEEEYLLGIALVSSGQLEMAKPYIIQQNFIIAVLAHLEKKDARSAIEMVDLILNDIEQGKAKMRYSYFQGFAMVGRFLKEHEHYENYGELLKQLIDKGDRLFNKFFISSEEATSYSTTEGIYEKYGEIIEMLIDYILFLDSLGKNVSFYLRHITNFMVLSNVKSEGIKPLIFASIKNGYFDLALKTFQKYKNNLSKDDCERLQYFIPQNETGRSISQLRDFILKNAKPDGTEFLDYLDESFFKTFSDLTNRADITYLMILCCTLQSSIKHFNDKEKCALTLIHVLQILGWEVNHYKTLAEVLSKLPIHDPDLSSHELYHLISRPKEMLSDSFQAFILFLEGEEACLQSDVYTATKFYSEAIEQVKPTLGAYFLKRGVLNYISDNLTNARADFFKALEDNSIKGYAEGWLMRLGSYQRDTELMRKIAYPFQNEVPSAYHSWFMSIAMLEGYYNDVFLHAELFLSHEDSSSPQYNYLEGIANVYKAIASHCSNDFVRKEFYSAELLKNVKNEDYDYRRFYLESMFHLLDKSSYIQQPIKNVVLDHSVDALSQPNICKIYINIINDALLMANVGINNKQSTSFAETILESLRTPKRGNKSSSPKQKGTKSYSQGIILYHLVGELKKFLPEVVNFEHAVILMSGRNLLGEEVYSYVGISVLRFSDMRDAALRGDDIKPSDYGYVLKYGRGNPSLSEQAAISLQYRMVPINPIKPLRLN